MILLMEEGDNLSRLAAAEKLLFRATSTNTVISVILSMFLFMKIFQKCFDINEYFKIIVYILLSRIEKPYLWKWPEIIVFRPQQGGSDYRPPPSVKSSHAWNKDWIHVCLTVQHESSI